MHEHHTHHTHAHTTYTHTHTLCVELVNTCSCHALCCFCLTQFSKRSSANNVALCSIELVPNTPVTSRQVSLCAVVFVCVAWCAHSLLTVSSAVYLCFQNNRLRMLRRWWPCPDMVSWTCSRHKHTQTHRHAVMETAATKTTHLFGLLMYHCVIRSSGWSTPQRFTLLVFSLCIYPPPFLLSCIFFSPTIHEPICIRDGVTNDVISFNQGQQKHCCCFPCAPAGPKKNSCTEQPGLREQSCPQPPPHQVHTIPHQQEDTDQKKKDQQS